jgi:hypothetical protein
MLCPACSEIFSEPREFGYGNFYPWRQTPASFKTALESDCHLCSLLYEHRSYSTSEMVSSIDNFGNVRYAFRALNAHWAQHGSGHKWLSLQHGDKGDDFGVKEYREMLKTPEVIEFSHLLTNKPEKLLAEDVLFWLVLEFYGSNFHVALPVEMYKGK